MLSTRLPLARPTALHPLKKPAHPPGLSFTQIQTADVLKELQNLDPFKSAGLDNLDPLFLKLSAKIDATPITSLINFYFVSSEIPKDWKAATAIPLFKWGYTRDTNWYRPTVEVRSLHTLRLESFKLVFISC
jgi:hypothetical protein